MHADNLIDTAMFEPKENPGYDKLGLEARNMIVSWLRNDWYESSSSSSSSSRTRSSDNVIRP